MAMVEVSLVLVLVAMVVVSLHLGDQGAAGVQCDERNQLQPPDGATAVHPLHVSGRWLLGAGTRDVPADAQHEP